MRYTKISLRTSLNWDSGHINNLYNTTFWALVQKAGMEARAAEEKLKVKLSNYVVRVG